MEDKGGCSDCHNLLAQAVRVPVGWCSGGRLAMVLMATINEIIYFFFFFSFFSFSPLSTFLIEGALGSKKLI